MKRLLLGLVALTLISTPALAQTGHGHHHHHQHHSHGHHGHHHHNH